jgi:transcriptional regulator with XRE-family HTH domain
MIATALFPTNSSLAERVAAEISVELAHRRRSQTALAGVLGKSQPTVSRRLRGQSPFTFNEVVAIADWLDVPVTRLFGLGD